jgi:hypothetical protein
MTLVGRQGARVPLPPKKSVTKQSGASKSDVRSRNEPTCVGAAVADGTVDILDIIATRDWIGAR